MVDDNPALKMDGYMTSINIQFTRFSAFYSPLISTISGGFLAEEGLEPTHSVAPAGKSAIDALVEGSAHVVQSALSNGLASRERGETPPARHFAQINEKDGFFLTAREPDAEFSWKKLRGKKILVDHGVQPIVMFRYACHRSGINLDELEVVDAGTSPEMDAAFRNGRGDYIHQQGPAPQQLEHEGVGHVVASVGDAIGPCGFSSLAATEEWLESDMAKAFMRAYRKTRTYINETPAESIAAAEASFFPNIDREVPPRHLPKARLLVPAVEITKPAYEVTIDVFEHAGRIKTRHPSKRCVRYRLGN